MTIDEICRAMARLIVENFTFRDMVVNLQAENRDLKEKLEENNEALVTKSATK